MSRALAYTLSTAVPIAMLAIPTLGWVDAWQSGKLALLALLAAATSLSQPPYVPEPKAPDDARTAISLMAWSLVFLGLSVLEARFLRGTTALVFGPVDVFAFAAASAGIALRAWSVKTLGRYFTLTVRVVPDQPVMRTGPYRFVRHPAYLGAMLIFAGLGLAVRAYGMLLVGLPIMAWLLARRIRVEEAALCRRLGAAYVTYQRDVPPLIPRLRSRRDPSPEA